MKGVRDFSGKNVFIFGGSTGIGLSLAKALSARGAHVMIFARTRSKLESAAREIEAVRQNSLTRVAWREVDVADEKNVSAVTEESLKDSGVPDLLINCAGRAYPGYFEDISFKQFDETMKVNMYGIWNTCKALVPHMKKKGGWIINTSSMAGFLGVFGYTDYAASKFAIIGFSESLRNEIEKYNIGVSVLCPPDTDTPGFAIENKTKPEETKVISGAAKIMTPDEVSQICLNQLKKGKKMIIPGFDGRMTYMLKRFAPCIVDMVMKRSVEKLQKK